jgi:hypothetical protein
MMKATSSDRMSPIRVSHVLEVFMNNDPISVPSAVKVENTAWLRKMITDFVNGSPENCLGANYREKAWGSPLVGFSRGDDPYYQCFKEDIGEFLWTPFEIFSKSFPNIDFDPSELSVICWVLPQTEATKADMRRQIDIPAERAALSRSNGEIFNLKVGQYVVNILNAVDTKRLPRPNQSTGKSNGQKSITMHHHGLKNMLHSFPG